MKHLLFGIVLCLVSLFASGCCEWIENWWDRDKPPPGTPITVIPDTPTEFSPQEALPLMADRLIFFLSMHSAAGKPALCSGNPGPMSGDLLQALYREFVAVPGTIDNPKTLRLLSHYDAASHLWICEIRSAGSDTPIFHESLRLKAAP